MNRADVPLELPPDIGIGVVALQIADLDRSLAYYRDTLRFSELSRDEGGGVRVARLGVPGERRVLLELHEKPNVRPVPKRGRLGLYHFAVLLPSRAELGRFLRHISERGVPLGASDHAVSEALYLTDPDGITMEVYRDRPRGEWRYDRTGAIEMTLLPLDGGAVVDSAGDEPWQGLPAGTTMGHMHFYVGDIAVARTFYLDGLGFTRMAEIPGALFAAAGGYHHHVGVNTWAAGSPIATADDAKLLYWELLLPDADTQQHAAARLRGAGYDVTSHNETQVASDPWGNTVRMMALRS